MSPAGELRTAAEALAAIAWLERRYDQPGVFDNTTLYAPDGLYDVIPDHDEECHCGIPGLEDLWTASDGAMKWGAR